MQRWHSHLVCSVCWQLASRAVYSVAYVCDFGREWRVLSADFRLHRWSRKSLLWTLHGWNGMFGDLFLQKPAAAGCLLRPHQPVFHTIADGCDGFGETFIEGETCGSARCGLLGASGACCTSRGCTDLPTSVACIGGSFRPGRTCEEINQCRPPEVMGACCDRGACVETSESTCDANGGIFAANAACTADLCAIPEPEGACCAGEGRCVETRESDCLAGEFDDGNTCDDATLCVVVQPPHEGACCVQGQCIAATHAECYVRGVYV